MRSVSDVFALPISDGVDHSCDWPVDDVLVLVFVYCSCAANRACACNSWTRDWQSLIWMSCECEESHFENSVNQTHTLSWSSTRLDAMRDASCDSERSSNRFLLVLQEVVVVAVVLSQAQQASSPAMTLSCASPTKQQSSYNGIYVIQMLFINHTH